MEEHSGDSLGDKIIAVFILSPVLVLLLTLVLIPVLTPSMR